MKKIIKNKWILFVILIVAFVVLDQIGRAHV